MPNFFRNGCIGVACSLAAMGANAETGGAAAAALDAAKSDVDATSPKVMLVVASVVAVTILIGLMRKA